MALHFLIKTQISLDNCVKFGDGLILEQHAAIRDLLRDRVGGQAAALFAEPLLSRGNDAAPASVSWYSEIDGKARPLSALPVSARGAVETYLSDTLAPLRALLDDPDAGPLLGAALWQLEPNDILVVGGRAVLVNWGMRPAHLGADASALSAHYAGTLGRYLPLTAPPGLAPASSNAASVARAAAPVVAGAAVAATAGAAIADGSTDGAGDMTRNAAGGNMANIANADAGAGAQTGASNAGMVSGTAAAGGAGAATVGASTAALPVLAWLPLAILLLLATLVLAWLLLPGTRLFPVADTAPVVTDQAALDLALDVDRDLRARRDALQAALDGAICRRDGTLVLPGGLTPDGLAPPALLPPGEAPALGDGPGDRVQAAPNSVLPPTPERVVVPDPLAEPDAATGELPTTSLLAVLENRTVLVLGVSNTSISNGTGFVVGPGLILTNDHVIADAARQGGQIMVFNDALPGPQPAEVLKTQGPLEQQGGDYALLRIADTSLPAYQVHRGQASLTLTNVVAAGFPGDVLETDTQFTALMQGDLRAVPGLSVTDGAIITEQALAAGTNVLVHSAPLSNGNSGGPLVDYCGRVVGINTFVRRGDLRTLNFALASEDLLTFLSGTPAAPTVVTEACAPQVTRPAPDMATPVPAALPADGDIEEGEGDAAEAQGDIDPATGQPVPE